jgi:TPR repeat protein
MKPVPAVLPLLALVVVTIAITPVSADYLEGLAAWRAGDYAGALRQWEPLAAAGDPDCLYRIGRMHYQGLGKEQDFIEAARLYQAAADSGHPRAMNDLGVMYENGQGVEADPEKAVQFYRKAAAAGRPVAQFNLARMYERGLGVQADPEEAMRWNSRAAESGHAGAQLAMARFYDHGRAAPRNPGKAAKWYRRAARQGSAPAMSRLGCLYDRGLGVKPSLEKAIEWYQKAAAAGDPAALRNLGSMYAQGTGVYRDLDLARKYFAEAGDVAVDPDDFRDDVARNGLDSLPVRRPDPVRVAPVVAEPAPEIVEEAETPVLEETPLDPDQLYELGHRHATGRGGAQDDERASDAFRQAAEAGHLAAAYDLAFMYLRNRVRISDRSHSHRAYAWVWFARCAEAGFGDAALWRDKVGKELSRKEREEADRLLLSIPWRSPESS